MKLMQRLESQTHSNMSENPQFAERVSDQKYIKGRQNHMDMKLPRTPDDFLDQIQGSADIIDEYFMPKILTMAKFHVEAINSINSTQKLPHQQDHSHQDEISFHKSTISSLQATLEQLREENKEQGHKISLLN